MIYGIICAIIAIGFDQITKVLVYGTATRSIIGDLLWFDSTLNTGIGFSLFEGMSYLFIFTSLVASGVFVWLIFSKKYFKSKLEKTCFGLILGGTFSNALDRIIFGGVRDFISLRFINFPIFNIADVAIVVGAIIFCVYFVVVSLRKGKTEETKKDK